MLAATTASTLFILCKGYPSLSQRTGNGKIYIRMILSGVLGGVSFFSASYVWAWYHNNINPVSGLGMVTIGAFGIVVASLIGALNIKKKEGS